MSKYFCRTGEKKQQILLDDFHSLDGVKGTKREKVMKIQYLGNHSVCVYLHYREVHSHINENDKILRHVFV